MACHLDHRVNECLTLSQARREEAMLLTADHTADHRLQRLAARVLP